MKNKIVSPLWEKIGLVKEMSSSTGTEYARLDASFLAPTSIPQNETAPKNETASKTGLTVNMVMNIIAEK